MNTQQENTPDEVAAFPSRTSITAATISLVLFFLFIFTNLGAFTLFASGASGLAAIIFGVMALKRGESRPLHITAIVIGSIFFLLSIGILVFAMIFVGAILT